MTSSNQYEFGNGPAYSIPTQVYPNRTCSPSRDVTPRGRCASSRSPNRNDHTLVSNKTISAISDNLEQNTPGCTDYTPNTKAILKKEPTYAPQTSARFFKPNMTGSQADRPHSYEDPNQRTFRRSNSGSFSRARRFKAVVNKEQIKNYLMTLQGNEGGQLDAYP